MLIACDFDGVVVDMRGRSYDDVKTPLRLMPGAKEGLLSLKRAGHVLLLYSARANRALRKDPAFDPLRRMRGHDPEKTRKALELNQARYEQMLIFVSTALPDVFDAVDDGVQGKPVADLFIDDRALRYGAGPLAMGWRGIMNIYGEPVYGAAEPERFEHERERTA